MLYKDENKTPRDRVDRELFDRLYDSETPGHTERRAYPRRQSQTTGASRLENPEDLNSRAPRPSTLPLAMVYAPSQEWRGLYDQSAALARGTLFRELEFPFYPTPCSKGRETRK